MSKAVQRRYIQTFQSGFDEGLRDVKLSFMQSDGGLTPVSRFSGHKAILSGPAGGCGLRHPALHWPLCKSKHLRYTLSQCTASRFRAWSLALGHLLSHDCNIWGHGSHLESIIGSMQQNSVLLGFGTTDNSLSDGMSARHEIQISNASAGM